MLGKTIYTHVIRDEYAARVHDPHTYDAVSRDVLRRWAYPLVPDANLLPGQSYRCGRGFVYKEDGIVLARNCAVVGPSAVGAGSSVGDGSTVRASVLGPGCTVGAGALIERSYLWAGVRVEDGARVRGAICCSGAVVGRGAVVEAGCILGPGVRVPAGATLSAFSRHTALAPEMLRKMAHDLDDDDEESSEAADTGGEAGGAKAAGSLGSSLGSFWRVLSGPGSMCHDRPAVRDPMCDEHSEPDEEEIEEHAVAEEEAVEEEQFAREVEATVQRGIENDHTVENVALEVNSLKFAQNRSFADCLQAITPTLLAALDLAGRPKKDRAKELARLLKRWGRLLTRFVQSAEDEDVLLATLISLATEEDALADSFRHLLFVFYDQDVLPEAAIMRWAEAARGAPAGSPTRTLLAKAEPIITWLQEASEDEDEGDN
jgi:translation initiation factor eIF-2B subunit epsilon